MTFLCDSVQSPPPPLGSGKELQRGTKQGPASFAEVALYFSSEEWALLNPGQRRLSEEVMMENHDHVILVVSLWDWIKRKEQAQSSQQRAHTGEEPHKRQEYGITFNWSGNIKCHQRTHTEEKPCKCQECGMVLNSSSGFKVYQRTHTEKKPTKCQECGTPFSQSYHLRSHHSIHTWEKPSKCQECGIAFNCSSFLKIHQRTHTGRNPVSARCVA